MNKNMNQKVEMRVQMIMIRLINLQNKVNSSMELLMIRPLDLVNKVRVRLFGKILILFQMMKLIKVEQLMKQNSKLIL